MFIGNISNLLLKSKMWPIKSETHGILCSGEDFDATATYWKL